MITTFYLKYLNVEHKWLDNTKTTVELMASIFGYGDVVLTYVHTDDDIETCKEKEDYYMEVLLNVIRDECKTQDETGLSTVK